MKKGLLKALSVVLCLLILVGCTSASERWMPPSLIILAAVSASMSE